MIVSSSNARPTAGRHNASTPKLTRETNGAYLATARPSPRNSTLELKVPLPSGAVKLGARVAMTNVPGNLMRENLPVGMGIRFVLGGEHHHHQLAARPAHRVAQLDQQPLGAGPGARPGLRQALGLLLVDLSVEPLAATAQAAEGLIELGGGQRQQAQALASRIQLEGPRPARTHQLPLGRAL